jgi:6-phosphogluconolactonase
MLAGVRVLADARALADAVADRVVAAARDAIDSRGRFVIALSGGSTPRDTYACLAAEPRASEVDWSRVHVLWGDERCVPPDDARSNYRMARETLLDRVPVPVANVHRIHGEGPPADAAVRYETTVRALLGTPSGPPRVEGGSRIDMILLGLGEDGHTASLFPCGVALSERSRWVVAEHVAAVSMWRITLTAPVIDASADILFVVAGGEKAAILRRVLAGPRSPGELPAQMIVPLDGRMRWFVDAAAASALETRA